MTEYDTMDGTEASAVETIAGEQYEMLTDEEAREFGRELLRLSDGLKFDAKAGQIVIGDLSVQLRLFPAGIDEESSTEFRRYHLDEHAEAWHLADESPVLELSWKSDE